MLLRSASTPILNSWTLKDSSSSFSSPEPDFFHHVPKSRPVSLSASSNGGSLGRSTSDTSIKKMNRTLSETDLREHSLGSNRRSLGGNSGSFSKNADRETVTLGTLLTSNGLGEEEEEEQAESRVKEREKVASVIGGSVGGGSGRKCGGNGDGSDGGGNWDSYFGNSGSRDAYYRNMIEAYPENSLLLGNYAKFLKEVKGDLGKAEEYCGRAILANPADANTLSLYADLIWEVKRDASRAENYFDQAVKTSPDDCYVLASYARFLWDAEEDEEELEQEQEQTEMIPAPPGFFQGVYPPPPPTPPPIAAAS